MREMERRVEDTKIAVFEAPGMEENVYSTAWIFGTFRGYLWNMLLESNLILPPTNLSIQISLRSYKFEFKPSKSHSLMSGA